MCGSHTVALLCWNLYVTWWRTSLGRFWRSEWNGNETVYSPVCLTSLCSAPRLDLCFALCVSCVSSRCGDKPNKGREDLLWFTIWGYNFPLRGKAWSPRSLATVSAVRQQREADAGTQPAFFVVSLASQLSRWWCPHSGWIFHLQFNLSGNTPIDIPEVCFHGDSKASHTDTEDEPLHLDNAARVGSHFFFPF